MKWLTLTEIARRARSKKGALEVSYEHWCQLYNATAKELREAYRETDKVFVDNRDCGLCVCYRRKRGNKCGDCPLRSCSGDSLYYAAVDALDDWCGSDGNWHTWKRAAKALRDKLKELMQE